MPNTRLVLLIEQDSETVARYRAALEAQGYLVMLAADGAAALTLAQEHLPQVIVGDFPMTLDGNLFFTVAVRRDERLSDVFIINVTDRLLTEKDSVAWMLSDRVLAKPVTGAKLAEEVARAMEGRGVLD